MLRRFIIGLMKALLDISIALSLFIAGAFFLYLLHKPPTDPWFVILAPPLIAIGLVTGFGLLSLLIEINENLIAIRYAGAASRRVDPSLVTANRRVEPSL